ncbi:uncharacterized protein JCM6883_002910 [Sporobolomyces salmoneus]|uniref:uncharacterized protein n=1 Tax=Sporobolomyces salmoneus TaxID=183962 RepID=UPI003174EE5F
MGGRGIQAVFHEFHLSFSLILEPQPLPPSGGITRPSRRAATLGTKGYSEGQESDQEEEQVEGHQDLDNNAAGDGGAYDEGHEIDEDQVAVAEHLDPASLLFMGRANKRMRTLFASKSSQTLWNTVKRRSHFPELECADLNDLAIMSLIYDRDCSSSLYLATSWAETFKQTLIEMLVQAYQVNQLEEEVLRVRPLSFRAYRVSACTLYREQTFSHGYTRNLYDRSDAHKVALTLSELDDAIAAARDQDEREDAKISLETYVAGRRAFVQAAFEDGKKLVGWVESSVAARQAADAAARQARLDAIKEKLLELGYQKEDFDEMTSVSTLLDQPTPLTPTIWKKISGKVIAAADDNRQFRLILEARSRAEGRRQLLKPFYQALRDDSTDKSLFKAFDLFTNMPAVRSLWKDEDSTIDEEVWHAALDEIQAQLPKVARWVQLEFARVLLEAYRYIDHPVADELVLSIHPFEPFSPPEAYYRDGYPHETALNLDDTSTISSVDLDAFLSRFSAIFKDSSFTRLAPDRWQEVHEDRSLELGLNTQHDIDNLVPIPWLRNLVGILKQTGLEDDQTAEERLDQLDTQFWCSRCHPDHIRSQSRGVGFSWKEMVQHAFQSHDQVYRISSSSPPLHIAYTGNKFSKDRPPSSPIMKSLEQNRVSCDFVSNDLSHKARLVKGAE